MDEVFNSDDGDKVERLTCLFRVLSLRYTYTARDGEREEKATYLTLRHIIIIIKERTTKYI